MLLHQFLANRLCYELELSERPAASELLSLLGSDSMGLADNAEIRALLHYFLGHFSEAAKLQEDILQKKSRDATASPLQIADCHSALGEMYRKLG